ncbi:gephyrin-like molybdotransferase Glp [Hoeflea poritis]|uniref:Molybdopterin molybdenumtransferase n=1 Tax=Hoeflea poritis TaxID=2993659 RepID=A0ABT4VI41_9HYPH|nr:gephyrin-like molybdotransferase Glp [Hoeflea poritis]MDA4844341.1 molybdopterin molybdotransferase MoeA [Hoeflea poritis]
MTGTPHLIDDCFLHDKGRMRHDDVVALITSRLGPVVGISSVRLDNLSGRLLAEGVEAPRNVPLHDNSAVDGYAFAHGDYAADNTMTIGPRIAAGDRPPAPLAGGAAARIFTGAVMPPNADTVAMQEDCTVSDDGMSVTIPAGLRPGANRRLAGEDVKAGDRLLVPGQRLRPQDIAALASLGKSEIGVFDKLRVAIVSTGNELVEPGSVAVLNEGQVFDTNRHMLAALCRDLPVATTDLGILEDDEAAISAALSKAAADHNVILTTGGASRGEEDHIVRTIDRLGKRHLWQIAIKPGRPMSFGQIGDCVFLGLPGNPVAAFVCFLLYCCPALRLLGGGTYREPRRYALPAGFAIKSKKPDRREFQRGWLETDDKGNTVVQKYPRDGSGLISGLRSAGGLIELGEDIRAVKPGDPVNYIPFSEFGITTG